MGVELSSDSWCCDDGKKKNDNVAEGDVVLTSVRLVATNPRSYAYMDKRRYLPASAVIATTIVDMFVKRRKAERRIYFPPLTSWYFGCQQAWNKMIARNTIIIVGDWKIIPICLRRIALPIWTSTKW